MQLATETAVAVPTANFSAPETAAARDSQFAEFTVAVPGNDFMVAIDGVKRERQAVDDGFDEATLGLNFSSAALDLYGEVGRSVAGRLIKTRNMSGQSCLLSQPVPPQSHRCWRQQPGDFPDRSAPCWRSSPCYRSSTAIRSS